MVTGVFVAANAKHDIESRTRNAGRSLQVLLHSPSSIVDGKDSMACFVHEQSSGYRIKTNRYISSINRALHNMTMLQ